MEERVLSFLSDLQVHTAGEIREFLLSEGYRVADVENLIEGHPMIEEHGPGLYCLMSLF